MKQVGARARGIPSYVELLLRKRVVDPGDEDDDTAEDPDHVDHFIYRCYQKDCYARFVLAFYRQSAAIKLDSWPFMREFELYCTYGSIRFRVTGASAMGDVWLSHDFASTDGYDLRVSWKNCSAWSDTPDA